jgi:hypothetical protein
MDQVCKQSEEWTAEYTACMRDLTSTPLRFIPAPLHITTMSIIVKLEDIRAKTSEPCLVNKMMQNFDLKRVRRKLSEIGILHYGLVNNGFGNSCTFEYKEKNMKSLKIFFNGQIQCSGVTCFSDIPIVSSTARLVVSVLLDIDIALVQTKLSFMNATFRLPFGINTTSMYDLLYPKFMGNIRMSPKIYKRLTIEHHGQETSSKVSIMVFHSGSIVLTGAKNPTALINACSFILREINSGYDSVYTPLPPQKTARPPLKRGRKRKNETFDQFVRGLM